MGSGKVRGRILEPQPRGIAQRVLSRAVLIAEQLGKTPVLTSELVAVIRAWRAGLGSLSRLARSPLPPGARLSDVKVDRDYPFEF
jgi:hypothetical protein